MKIHEKHNIHEDVVVSGSLVNIQFFELKSQFVPIEKVNLMVPFCAQFLYTSFNCTHLD